MVVMAVVSKWGSEVWDVRVWGFIGRDGKFGLVVRSRIARPMSSTMPVLFVVLAGDAEQYIERSNEPA